MFLGEDRSSSGSDRALRSLAEAAGQCDPVVFTRELSALLGELDLKSLDGARLMDAVLAMEGLRRALDAMRAKALIELEANDTTYAEVGLATKNWKATRTHVSPGFVARELRLARTLQRFVGFERALTAGVISAEHVHALANASNPRVVDALLEIEDSLVTFASRNRFAHFVAHLRSVVALLDEDGAEPDHGDHNNARMAADGTGNLHLVMDLTGVDAVTAQRIITEETDRQYRNAVNEHETTGAEVPAAPVLRARAITELLSRGAKANPNSPKPAVEAIISLHTDRDGRPAHVRSIDGEPVDPITAAILLCDAHLQPVVTGPDGNPLRLGRTTRLFSAGQRRALAVRDGGCTFPGCDQPVARCAAHHMDDWILDGPTNLDNGALLCPRHHGLVHGSNPWTIELIDLEALDPDLQAQHEQRAGMAGLDPVKKVRIWHGPNGQILLAQTAADHHGPTTTHPQHPYRHRRAAA